ncbi:MAG TPA: site-2 protease family protein [Candidatus Colwellbacteria bacterium]|nr:site-2 protease family protein [Candidatus Colwellbacteria bacterium]HQA95999.1 site-2 protease family protein [Candidatus Colwellbacteria bacterium]
MDILVLYVIIILSAVFHEYSHGLMALELGDPTARDSGRLTLNPIPHLDMTGTVIVPLLSLFFFGSFIGWAKPVPVNPFLFKDQKNGILKVSVAGIAANMLLAAVFGLFIRLGTGYFSPVAIMLFEQVVIVNISLGLFNLLPFPPLDGSKIFHELFPRAWTNMMKLGAWGILLALFTAQIFLPAAGGLIFKLFTGQGY